MMFCARHNHWYQKAKCDKCEAGKPHYRYVRDEVADPHGWARFVRLGWVK